MNMNVPLQVTADPPREKKIYAGVALRLLKLLGAGCTQREASQACGVDESYTSQLLKEKEFEMQVNEIIEKSFAEQSKIDNNYTELEKKLSDRLLSQSEFMHNPDQILRTLKFANEAKRRVAHSLGPKNDGTNGNGNTTILAPVTLIFPQAVANEFILNPNNEVVGVGGEALTTLPSQNITKLADEHSRKRIESRKSNGTGRHEDPWADL